jgi:hypothetical protein
MRRNKVELFGLGSELLGVLAYVAVLFILTVIIMR